MGCADFLGCPKNVLDAEPRRMSSRDVRYVCSLTPVLQRGCTCCRCSRARKPRYSACKPRSGRRSSSRSAYVPFLFFFITLRARTLTSSMHAARGFAGLRLPPPASGHGGGPTGRLRDLHGCDRASAGRHVGKAEAARRTGARIVQSGALRTSLRKSSRVCAVEEREGLY